MDEKEDKRRKRNPIRGCVRWVSRGVLVTFLLLAIAGGVLWLGLGSRSLNEFLRTKIETTLSARLDRDVSIGSIETNGLLLGRFVIKDLRIANAPGGVHPYFATVRKIAVTGRIRSFLGRRISIDRIDVAGPRMFVEIYPVGAPLTHNVPRWQLPPPSRFQLVHVAAHRMFIEHGLTGFLDRRHDIEVTANEIQSAIDITTTKSIYAGVATSPRLRVRLEDFAPFDMRLQGRFRYSPGALELQSIALDGGPDLRVSLDGRVDPLSDGVYSLHMKSVAGLNRVRDIFRVQRALEGTVESDTTLRGRQGTFTLAGSWTSPKIHADTYRMANLRGRLRVNGETAAVDIDRADFAGGGLTARYLLTRYAEPYPMSVDVRYNGVSAEQLFAGWGLADTGLRGGAAGRLTYRWDKDRILEGAGEGTATLARSGVALSRARYPVPIGGSVQFGLNHGVITFRNAGLATDLSRISFTGKLRIADLAADLHMKIHGSDFSELDRIATNFAHATGKKTYTLLGLGGAGDMEGNVSGPLGSPDVTARVVSTGTRFNNVLLGEAEIDLRYSGARDLLTLTRAAVRENGGRLMLTGTIAFPGQGPSPRFDMSVDAEDYPVERATRSVGLNLAISGRASGHLMVAGTPDHGRVTFASLTVTQQGGPLHLTGTAGWAPGVGNVTLDLDVTAKSFPVAGIIEFLDLGSVPVSGGLTGTLRICGPKSALEGSGQITVRDGSMYGEPVTSASANIRFSRGTLQATDLRVSAPAGSVTGHAELTLGTNQFGYSIQSAGIDVSRLRTLSSLSGFLGGSMTVSSTGAGTLLQPEIVFNATLNGATLRGISLPRGAAPPALSIAVRDGQVIARGSAAGVLTIEGKGTFARDGTVGGLLRLSVSDIAGLLAISPNTASMPAAGNITAELRFSGKPSPVEALQIDLTFPDFNVRVSGQQFVPLHPLHISLRDGRVAFDEFQIALGQTGSTFAAGGYAEITGAKRVSVDVRGTLEAALLQLVVRGTRADGHVDLAGGVRGTLASPTLNGTAEFRDAEVRFPGFPQLIDHITGTLVFGGDRVEIDSLRANVGGGTVVAGGSITLQGVTPVRARIAFQGSNVAIRYFEGFTLEGDFKLLLSGDAGRAILQGDVNVLRAVDFRDLDIGNAILGVLLARRDITPLVAASWQDHVSLRVHLSAPGTLAVRNNIADATGSGNLDLTGTLANPSLLGTVTLDEGGKVRFQNIEYQVVRGSINFQNPFRIDPYFDITLGAIVSGGVSDIGSGPIEVTVNVTGTVDRITPTITSEPPASDVTLFSLLGLGGLATSTGAQSGAGASLARQSLLYQSLNIFGKRVLPFVDSFTVDPGQLDTTGDPGPKAAFEKRLSNNLRLFVVHSLRDQKNRVVIEWQVNRDWILQFARDELSNEYRAEARFRRTFDGRWSWGEQGANPGALVAGPRATGRPRTTPLASVHEPVAPPPGTPNVTSVEFTADSRFDPAALSGDVTVKAGRPLSVREVQASIRNLYAVGDFRDIRVSATPSEGGVAVTFALFMNYRAGDVRFEGLSASDRERAAHELTFHAGDVFSLNAVDRSATAIQDSLVHSGYLDAVVDPETMFARAQSKATVIFHVDRGPRATVGSVIIDGTIAPFKPDELIARMRQRPARAFDLGQARGDADRMKAFMVRRDYRKADVRYLGYTHDKAGNRVALRYRASAGPIVRVQVMGVPRGAVRGLLPFRKGQPYSEDVIDKAADDIISSLQAHGFFNVSVDTEEALANNVWTITFHVSPGKFSRLSAVTFSGNQKLQTRKLAAVISTAVSSAFRFRVASLFRRAVGVTQAQLSADRDSLESFYRLNGFSDVLVAPPVVSVDDARGTMTVDFPIAEGPRTMVTAVHVEGNRQVPAGELPDLQIRAGGPLNPQLERQDVVTLQLFYADRGNAEVQVRAREEVSADKTSAAVTYVIDEGPSIKVDQVIVQGNTYTKSNLVLRRSEIDRGDPFSYTSILEAQRNLYRLGIFRRVDIQPEQVAASASDRNILISVEEGKDLTLVGAAGLTSGIQTSDNRILPLGSVSLSHRNLFGSGRYLGMQFIGAPNRQDAFITYREPFLGRWNIPVQLTLFQSDAPRSGAHLRQRGTFIEASATAGARAHWSLRYEYRISNCIIQRAGDVCAQAAEALLPGFDRSISNIKIADVTPAFFWDRRDDPLNPHHGFFTSASVEYAFRAFSADAHFVKEFAQGSWYLPVSERSVFAVSSRIGVIQALGGSVPLSERFTAGGDSSNRAYALDLLGTICLDKSDASCRPTLIRLDNGTIAPIGGNGLFIANAEYRFPIYSSLGGAMFVDAGNIFSNTAIRLGDLRYGVGSGLRYLSPIGPVRLDVGYKLKRQIIGYDSRTGRALFERPYAYFITIGYAF